MLILRGECCTKLEIKGEGSQFQIPHFQVGKSKLRQLNDYHTQVVKLGIETYSFSGSTLNHQPRHRVFYYTRFLISIIQLIKGLEGVGICNSVSPEIMCMDLIRNPKEVTLYSYRVIFLLPHLISNCLFPKERIIHELMDLTGPNTGHTSQYCTASVPSDIGTSLHPDETVSCSRWKFPPVLRLPVLGRVGSQMGILAEVTITLSCSFKL